MRINVIALALFHALAVCIILGVLVTTQNAVADDNVLRFGVIELPPYGCKTPHHQVGCFQNQLLARLQQELATPLDVQVMPYPRAIASIQNGAIDLLITLDMDFMNEFATAVAKVGSINISLYRHPIEQLEDNNRTWRLGVLRNAYYGDALHSLANVEEFPVLHFQQAVSMFARKRLDGIVGPSILLRGLLEKENIDPQSLWQPLPEWQIQLIMYMNNTAYNQAIAEKLAQALAAVDINTRAAMMNKAIEYNSENRVR